MNVLILGNNEVNSVLEKGIRQEGFQTDIIKDVNDVVSVKGEPGAFVVKTSDNEFLASSVIITEPYSLENVVVGEGSTLDIMCPKSMDKLDLVKSTEKIVFLLDYITESPEFIAVKAMQMAKKLVDRKKKVYFLSKFVKTLSRDMEQAYRDARSVGVTFIKYEDVCLSFDEDTQKFTVKANDGVFETVIETKYVVSEAGRKSGSLNKIAGKLRLSQYNNGLLNEDRFFVSPSLTSRKGIFYLNPDVSATRLEEGLKVALPAINEIEESLGYDDDDFTHAVVDARKCAFCYSCYRACPHGAMEPDLENSAMINTASACQACGTCVAVCPGEAIYINDEEGLTADSIKPGKSNKCKVFCCENSAYVAFNEISSSLGENSAKLDVSSMPCGGRMSLEMITTALSTYGKVLVAVCMDDACRHWGGGKRACLQLERTMDMLKKAGITEKQVKCIKVSHVMENILKENIEAFLQD